MDDQGEPVGETWKYDPDYHRVADSLGVNKYDREDFAIANKISILTDWGKLRGKGSTIEDAMTAMKELQRSRGLPYIGKPLVEELYRNIRLELDKKSAKIEEPPRPKAKEQTKPKQDVIGNIVGQTIAKDKNIQKAVGQAVQNAVQQQVANQVQQAVKTLIK